MFLKYDEAPGLKVCKVNQIQEQTFSSNLDYRPQITKKPETEEIVLLQNKQWLAS